MSSDENPAIIEEVRETPPPDTNTHGDNAKQQQGKFSRGFGNVLRRSKRLMSGKKRTPNPAPIPENREIKSEEQKENNPPSQPQQVNGEKTNGVVTKAVNDEKDKVDGKNDEKKEQDSFEEPSSPRTRKQSQTFYGSERQVVRDGKKIKEIEVRGEAPDEPIDMKKQKKLQRKKSIDKEELNVACRSLGKADHEGWMYKKAGGHGIVPVSWKKFWVVIKLGRLYCYKTSFNIQADYMLIVNDYTVDNASEKKKNFAFHMKPNEEDGKKAVTFACEQEQECNEWIEVINKILSGIDLSKDEDTLVPDYEDHKRLNGKHKDHESGGRKRPTSTAFQPTDKEETTGLPSGFGTRTSSTSQPRVRKMSAGTGGPSSILSVGSMFHTLEEKPDANAAAEEDVELKDLLYKEVVVETEEKQPAEQQPMVNGAVEKKAKAPPPPVAQEPAVVEVKKQDEENKTRSIDAETIIKELEEKAKQEIAEEEAQKEPIKVEEIQPVAPEEPKQVEQPAEVPAPVEPEPQPEAVEPIQTPAAPVEIEVTAQPETVQEEAAAPASTETEAPASSEEAVTEEAPKEETPKVEDVAAAEVSTPAAPEIQSESVSEEKPVEQVVDAPEPAVVEVAPPAPPAEEAPAPVSEAETPAVSSEAAPEIIVEPATPVEAPDGVSFSQTATPDEQPTPTPPATPQQDEASVAADDSVAVVVLDASSQPEIPKTESEVPAPAEPTAAAVDVTPPQNEQTPQVEAPIATETKTESDEKPKEEPAVAFNDATEAVESDNTTKNEVSVDNTDDVKVTASLDDDDDLDIPDINSGDSSLMDDITMELASSNPSSPTTKDDQNNSVVAQPNGSAVLA